MKVEISCEVPFRADTYKYIYETERLLNTIATVKASVHISGDVTIVGSKAKKPE